MFINADKALQEVEVGIVFPRMTKLTMELVQRHRLPSLTPRRERSWMSGHKLIRRKI